MQKNTARVRWALLRAAGFTALAFALVLLYRVFLHVNQTTVALSFLVIILIAASRWRLAYSVYLSFLCAILYNYFFLPPIGRLTISDPQNLVALAAFLSASLLVSHLSSRARNEAELAESRRREVQQLYEFSQELLLHDDLSVVARITPSIAATIFGFRAVALYVREGDTAYYSDPGNELVPLANLRSAAEAPEPAVSSSGDLHLIPLLLGMRSLGAIAIRGSAESTKIYEAIGSLVAIALERAAALDRTSHMEAARESERLHTALLDSVTHDLRTPLTSIRAAATTLLSQPGMNETARREMYTVVDQESARLDRLVGQAIETAQLDASSIHVQVKPERIREIVALALEEAQPLLSNASGERSVAVQIPEDMPPVRLDRRLVRRVLRHLIENAVKYSPPGSPLRITARIENERLLVSVEDSGPGIEEFEKPLIFRKFYRGRKQRHHSSGTGVGLAIVKAILDAHGGGIEVASRPSQGAQFTFWLPVGSAEANVSV
ncbi:MAG TPA: ATP-binding protein [Silvibacterium sp.]|nr:ATP-binding protein [Silvibacterium sp.]